MAYLPDHSVRLAPPERRAAADDLVRGVDVLLHGAGYLEDERAIADNFAHATVDDAIELATAGAVGRLVLIHHVPRRTDTQIAALEERLPASSRPFPVDVGREGDWVEVGGRG